MTDVRYSPIRLTPTRVRRTYKGGAWLNNYFGQQCTGESNQPEAWIASMTEARNPGFPTIENEGLTTAVLDGQTAFLKDLVSYDPEWMLGVSHVQRFGNNPGMLAKIIDSAERLSVQVHPDKAFAQEYFHSEYGKTECWHILDTRTVDGQEPYLLMGFRPGVTRNEWEYLYQKQDIPGMVNCLNRVIPHPGDTWLIQGGMPHAIGPGCILVEIQEPTDFTLRTERSMADGTPIPDALIHQGLGEKALFDCFHYIPMDLTDVHKNCLIPPAEVHFTNGSCWQLLIGPHDTECFSMDRLTLLGSVRLHKGATFSSVTVLSGEGVLKYEGGTLPLQCGESIFLPAAINDITLHQTGQNPLQIIRCYPPGVEPHTPSQV